MKQLILIRHAQAKNPNAQLSDFERPLSSFGKENAAQIGKRLAQQVNIQKLFTSPAERALTTARIIGKALQLPEYKVLANTELYSFDMEDIYSFIECLDDQLDSVAIVGHNPAITLLANDLTFTSINNVPTAGVINIQLNISSWVDIQSGVGKLVSFEYT